jgi:glycosyltransferase involved in cell wall biosynthesis
MRILFVADGRSPIAQNWIRFFVERGDEVHLVSTFPFEWDVALAGRHVVPVAFSGVKGSASPAARIKPTPLAGSAAIGLRMRLRQWLGPLTVYRAAKRLAALAAEIKPDLVHAMRIPYEGMLAADAGLAMFDIPLLVSVWGNDFTLHAPSTPLMRHYTEWTLKVANALHADCRRDVRLARQWGFATGRPSLVLPGNGGIDTGIFHPPAAKDEPLVVNPRGFRGYVRNDTFFKAIPLVLAARPDARFACPAMQGTQAEGWVDEPGIRAAVTLLPSLPRTELAGWLQRARVLVSPSTHDGTPNSLLEGMACGCLPVAGDLESIREWITQGKNGLLVDPADPRALADAILRGLNDRDLQKQASEENVRLIAARAEYRQCMAQAGAFYQSLVG